MNGIINAIPNNWKQIAMGEAMMQDLICNGIADQSNEENKPCKYLNKFFREFDKSLLCDIANEKTI